MDLLLFRHGEAAPPGTADSDRLRELTDRGADQLRRVALWLQARDESPGLILHSPYRRTTQTAKVLAESQTGRSASVRPAPWLAPGSGDLAAALTESLGRVSQERVAVVGHQPEVGQAAAVLTGGSHIAFSPGTVACIRFEGVLQPGHGTLQWLLAASLFHGDY